MDPSDKHTARADRDTRAEQDAESHASQTARPEPEWLRLVRLIPYRRRFPRKEDD